MIIIKKAPEILPGLLYCSNDGVIGKETLVVLFIHAMCLKINASLVRIVLNLNCFVVFL